MKMKCDTLAQAPANNRDNIMILLFIFLVLLEI